MKSRVFSILLFLLSFAIVAFGQPSWLALLAPVAAVGGFALFWYMLVRFKSFLTRFLLAAIWFTGVQMIQLSWMTSIEYQGLYILVAYFWFATWLGVQFGLLSLLIPREGRIKPVRLLALASLWTILEWSRFYFLCGFSWSPSGIALTSNLFSLQLASVGGVLGLSFWVMLVNGCTYNLLTAGGRTVKAVACWIVLAGVPYFFGIGQIIYHNRADKIEERKLNVALVQTGLLPAEKLVLPQRVHHFISPWEQWQRILVFLKSAAKTTPIDLIVFPEVAVPFHCDRTVYPQEAVVQILAKHLGKEVYEYLPPLKAPYAEQKIVANELKWMVSNCYWTQALSNYFNAEVVIGLEHCEKETEKSYNAAFHFVPQGMSYGRYEKQILLPLAEYLPFKWAEPLANAYGIGDFFTRGSGTKVFKGIIPLAISICYEETFPDLIREGRQLGAELLVNVTNDNWYPSSRLPKQHFDLGRLRAVENGTPLLRACNTGVTAVIDGLGRVLGSIDELDEQDRLRSGVLVASLPIRHYSTLYTHWGDGGIVGLSMIFFGIFLRFKRERGW